MKVIFLDIDGVLNSTDNQEHKIVNNLEKPFLGVDREFCPIAMLNLKKIIYTTNARVVISSCWRLHPEDILTICKNFSRVGLNVNYIVGFTPVSSEGRAKEISLYLEKHSFITNFVILDDDMDVSVFELNFVKVDTREGLSVMEADLAINVLAGVIDGKKVLN